MQNHAKSCLVYFERLSLDSNVVFLIGYCLVCGGSGCFGVNSIRVEIVESVFVVVVAGDAFLLSGHGRLVDKSTDWLRHVKRVAEVVHGLEVKLGIEQTLAATGCFRHLFHSSFVIKSRLQTSIMMIHFFPLYIFVFFFNNKS